MSQCTVAHIGWRDGSDKAVSSADHDLAQVILFTVEEALLASTDVPACFFDDDHASLGSEAVRDAPRRLVRTWYSRRRPTVGKEHLYERQ